MMRKLLASTLMAMGVVLLAHKPIFASEGTAILAGETSDAKCFAAAVLVAESDYQLVMTCRNLNVPPATEKLFYRAWAKRKGADIVDKKTTGLSRLGRGSYISLGDITDGKLAARTREPFDELLVTSESVSSPDKPNLDETLVAGVVKPIEFQAGSSGLRSEPTLAVERVMPPAGKISPTPMPAEAKRSVVGTALRVFLTVLGIIVAAAIAISVIQRRSASK